MPANSKWRASVCEDAVASRRTETRATGAMVIAINTITERQSKTGKWDELVGTVAGQARVLSVRPSPFHFEIEADVLTGATLRVNVFYFPGWTLYVDGHERPINITSPQGVIEFALEPGPQQMHVLFRHTPIRLWSTWLSLLSAVVLLLSVCLMRTRRWGPKEPHVSVRKSSAANRLDPVT